MRKPVHNSKDSAVFEGRVDDILHDGFRLAIDTNIRTLVPAFLQYPPMAFFGLPASGLVEYQYFALSNQGSCKTQQLFLAC